MIEKELGKITKTELGKEDHGIFTFYLYLDFGGHSQGFGGYTLGKEGEGCGAILKILDAVGVKNWEDLPGRIVGVMHDHRGVYEIEAPDFIPHEGSFKIKEYFEGLKLRQQK